VLPHDRQSGINRQTIGDLSARQKAANWLHPASLKAS
jgi:hypothetical protein